MELMTAQRRREQLEHDDAELKTALHLIKLYIEPEDIPQNRHLHDAVQRIVTVARRHGLLLEHGAR